MVRYVRNWRSAMIIVDYVWLVIGFCYIIAVLNETIKQHQNARSIEISNCLHPK